MTNDVSNRSMGRCNICSYEGPGPAHDCRPSVARVTNSDPLETEKLAHQIVALAAHDVEATRALVDSLTGDQVLALARCCTAWMPPKIGSGPGESGVFLDMLTAAMKDAAIELVPSQLAITIQPVGFDEPKRLRVVIVPEELTFRTAKAQPLGSRTKVKPHQ